MQCSLAYSPCPNDTYIFYALAHRKIDTSPFEFSVEHQDIATLNQMAHNAGADLIKVSCVTYARIQERYTLLSAGAAFGKGFGPVLLIRPGISKRREDWKSIALPGPHTTAHLLFKLWYSEGPVPVFLPFHQIMAELVSGKLDAGVVIHESRFTYEQQGLVLQSDLGKWWWDTFQMPLPLGVICCKRSWDSSLQDRLNGLIRESIRYSEQNLDEVMSYIRRHAQESDEAALKNHIALYVNEYTRDFGMTGREAIEKILEQSRWLFSAK